MRYLVDTNILIDHLRGKSAATQWLERVERGEYEAAVSVLTEYELFVVPRLSEYQAQRIMQLFSLLPLLPVTSAIAHRAALIHRDYHTDLADAIIAATAIEHEVTLLTQNVKDFERIKGLQIVTL